MFHFNRLTIFNYIEQFLKPAKKAKSNKTYTLYSPINLFLLAIRDTPITICGQTNILNDHLA